MLCGKIQYNDKTLPFGLHSAPKVFSVIADVIQWILIQKGNRNIIHYLDDYILVAKEKDEADYQKSQLVELGVPIEPSKLKGPSQCLSFLGIEEDTVWLGRPFLRRLYAVEQIGKLPSHHVCLKG